MRRVTFLFTGMFLLFIGLTVNAQDVGVTSVKSTKGLTKFTAGFTYQFDITVENLGSSAISAFTVIPVTVQIGAQPLEVVANLFFSQNFSPGATSKIDSIPVRMPAISGSGSYSLCIGTNLSSDINNANDTICMTYSFYSRAVDVAITSITSPSAGSTIEKGKVNPMSIQVKNNSDTTLPAKTLIPAGLSLGGGETNITISTPTALSPGATFISSRLINVPQAAPSGTTDICFFTKWDIDTVNNNDTACNNYDVIQADIDLGFSRIVSPVPGSKLSGTQLQISAILHNYGTSTILAGADPITIQIKVGNLNPATFTSYLQQNLVGGDSNQINLTLNSQSGFPQDPNIQVCVSTNLANDNDHSNDEACETYNAPSSIKENITETYNLKVFPNPVDEEASMRYSLANAGLVNVLVYNMNGELVKNLFSGQQQPGDYILNFNVNDLDPGTYIYHFTVNGNGGSGNIVVK